MISRVWTMIPMENWLGTSMSLIFMKGPKVLKRKLTIRKVTVRFKNMAEIVNKCRNLLKLGNLGS